jgi:acid phosphatase
MGFTRRRFLVLAGLTSLGVVGLSRRGSSPSISQATSPPQPQLEMPSEEVLLRFLAIADTGSGDRNQFAVGNAMANYHAKSPYELVVMAGDNIYNRGEMDRIGVAFEQPYATLLKQGVKFHACLGNHDIRTENGNPQVAYPGFNMGGRRFYTYSAGPVQFFVLDTNDRTTWKTQLTWLEKELSQSQAPWKVVYGHHPIYSSGFYGTDSERVKTFAPLFQKYGVQLYINGHEHDYERTNPIASTTYLITGIGGASLRPVGQSKWTAYSTSRYGFSALEVRQNTLTIQGIDVFGQVFDQGTVAIAV